MEKLRREFLEQAPEAQATESNFQAFLRTCKLLSVNVEEVGVRRAKHAVSSALSEVCEIEI